MRHFRLLLFFAISIISSCAKRHFYQPTALVSPNEQKPVSVHDSVLVTAGRHYDKSFAHRILFGSHYRNLWATPVYVPVFHADSLMGGLEVTSKGGGMQTKSVKFKDAAGREYALRSLDKDPAIPLSNFLQKTFIATLLRDQTSAANPYGAFVLEPLAKASGILYTHPQLVYLRENDPALGEWSSDFGGQLMLFEERNEDKIAIVKDVHGKDAKDMVDTEDLLRKLFAENDHRIDQQAFARARLFDILIGDWDRHEGQWQWLKIKDDGENYYKPIPKDRDQAFYKFRDGILPWLSSRFFPGRKLTTFKDEVHDLKALLYNAKFIDDRALNEVTLQEWVEIAHDIKNNLTDDVIEKAIAQWPKPIYDQVGAETIRKLKKRRDNLPDTSLKVYKMLAKNVLVYGSDEKEIIKVYRKNNQETLVELWRPDDNDKPDYKFYSRTFYRDETETVTIYGLDEDDVFEVEGNVKKGIDVILVGGLGEDEFTDNSKVSGLHKHTIVKDTHRGTEINKSSETRDARKRNISVNLFDREGY